MKIVFMGTPYFAVGVLEHLLHSGKHEIVAVVTATDKPAGRGKRLSESAVKQFAVAHNLKLLQPPKLKDPGFVQALEQLQPDVMVVVAFRMLPQVVWQIPKYGTINLHASLLPAYRGAAPINWAIINGETQTGVTTFFIDDKIDTGAVLMQKRVNITPDETAGSLHDKLLDEGKKLVAETLDALSQDSLIPQPQEQKELTKAPKLTKTNTQIDWQQDGKTIEYFIRGLSPYPVAWTYISVVDDEAHPKTLKIYNAYFESQKHEVKTGTVIIEKNTMSVAVKDGKIFISEIQYPGKRKMPIGDFLNGFKNEQNMCCF